MKPYTTLDGAEYYAELTRVDGKHLITIRNRVYKTKVFETEVVGSSHLQAIALLREWDEKPIFDSNAPVEVAEVEPKAVKPEVVWWFLPTSNPTCFNLVTVEKHTGKIIDQDKNFTAAHRTDAARLCHRINEEHGIGPTDVILVLETVSDKLRQIAEAFKGK